MKILPRIEQWELVKQTLDCMVAAKGPFTEGVSEQQHLTNTFRGLRLQAIDDKHNDIAGQIARTMNEFGIPMEPTSEEFTGETSLTDRLNDAFRFVGGLLHARRDDINDEARLANADSDIVKGRAIIEGLIKDPLNREMKEGLEAALKEYNAAAIIACSDDLAITRETALAEAERRGRKK